MRTDRLSRNCQQCGTGFAILQSRVRRGAGKFCSGKCAHAAKTKKVERACSVCGASFFAFYYLRNTQKACSQTCAGKIRRSKVKRACLTCGKEFLKSPSQFKYFKGAGKYCSRKCSYAGTVKRTADRPTSDRWGRTRRTADRHWQQAVREKDRYTCQRCGKVEKHIHAHHVAPRSRRPDLKHEVSNGKCLCNSCHTWVHRNPIEATALGLLSDASYELAQKSKCRVCGLPAQGYQLCPKHYTRWRKHGDPMLTMKPGRPAAGATLIRER